MKGKQYRLNWFHDTEDYSDVEITDERFVELINNREKYDAHNNEIQPTAESSG